MISFEQIPTELEKNGKLLAKARAEWEYCDDMKKVILAKTASGLEGSEISKEREARKSDEYQKYLEAVKQARIQQLELQAIHEALTARFEWYRSQNANVRAEIKMQ